MKIVGLSREVGLWIDQDLSPAARSKAFASFAETDIAQIRQANARATGRPSPVEVFVDGRRGAPLASVRPDGVIVAEFDIIADAVTWIADELKKRSPVLKGRYRDNHVLLANNAHVNPAGRLPEAEEYVFLSPTPYARKIEMGKMQMRVKDTDRVYQRVNAAARRRFSNIARINFTYRPAFVRGSRKSERAPAITIRPR